MSRSVLERRDHLLLAAGRDPLAAVVEDALVGRCGVSSGASLLLGFSGGVDSTALLVLLAALRTRPGSACGALTVLHLDHGLRPESSDEAIRAAALCDELGVPCEVVALDLDGHASDLAARARDHRYRALERCAVAGRHDAVVVAHQAEDRFETILQGLCRGAGAAGLTSPRWRRALGGTSLVRPLLETSRGALEAFCEGLGLAWLRDPTNERLDTARGLLRANVICVLEDRWPGASVRASMAADRLETAAAALDLQLEEVFGPESVRHWSRELLRGLEPGLLTAGLRRALVRSLGLSADGVSAERLLDIARACLDGEVRPRRFEFGDGVTVELDRTALRILESGADSD